MSDKAAPDLLFDSCLVFSADFFIKVIWAVFAYVARAVLPFHTA